METEYDRVQKFTNALKLAIYDREIEEVKGELVFFYDADVSVDAIIGLTSWNRSKPLPDTSALRFVVRALLTTGFLPRIHLLRPHLAEFYRVLRRLPDTQMLEGFHREAMAFLAAEWSLPETEEELKDIAQDQDAFANYVKEKGYGVFVRLELCLGGHWKNRLSRVLSDGNLNLLAPAGAPFPRPGDPVMNGFATLISQLRPSPQVSVSNLVDAYALAELNSYVEGKVPVRFYTETEPIRAAAAQSNTLTSDSYTVLRQEEYFLIRSSFTALSFNRRPPRRAGSTGSLATHFGIDDLRELRDKLLVIVADSNDVSDAVIEAALKAETVKGIELGEVIKTFYKLGFLDSIFLRWDPPPEMKQWLPTLYDVKSNDPKLMGGARANVALSLSQVWKKLDEQVGQLRDWREDLDHIVEAVTERVKDFQSHIPDIAVELGLGRWGLEQTLPKAVRDHLERTINNVLGDRQARELVCSELAIRFGNRNPTTDDFAYLVCIFWFLRLDKLLLQIYHDNSQDIIRQAAPALRTLLHVARVRTAASRSADENLSRELAAIVSDAELDVTNAAADPTIRGFAEMGLAHIAYWAWRETGEQTSGLAHEWAKSSFLAAQRAERLFMEGTLAWAFSVNHCAYMGIRAGLFPGETDSYLLTLIQRIGNKHYHYRFADTIAWSYTAKVEAEVRRCSLDDLTHNPQHTRRREQLCRNLDKATEILSENQSFGDIEVKRHRDVVAFLQMRLGCP